MDGTAENLRSAAVAMAGLSPDRRAAIIDGLADCLDAGAPVVFMMNARDAREPGATAHTPITREQLDACLASIRAILQDADPLEGRRPVGVVAVLHQGSPLDTALAAALCLARGNACTVWPGTHAPETNGAIGKLIGAVLRGTGAPEHALRVLYRAGSDEARAAADSADVVVHELAPGWTELLTRGDML